MVYQALVAVICFCFPSMLTLSRTIHSNSFKCWICVSVVSSMMSSNKVWSWREKMVMVFPDSKYSDSKYSVVRWIDDIDWLLKIAEDMYLSSCSCSSSRCLQIDLETILAIYQLSFVYFTCWFTMIFLKSVSIYLTYFAMVLWDRLNYSLSIDQNYYSYNSTT